MFYTFDENLFSDMHKDAYGFRPRGHAFYNADTTDAVKQRIWDAVCEDVEAAIERENNERDAAQIAWEDRIAKLCADHNIDRATAIRWDMDAEDAKNGDTFDIGFYCYLVGIRYVNEHNISCWLKEDSK